MRSVARFGPGLAMAAALAFHHPAANACSAHQAMIFFGSGSAEILPDQAERLDAFAAGLLQSGAGSRLSIHGFTDRRGRASANLALSRRRAEGVRAYLAARGVPDGLIDVRAAGEAQPLLTTADGVKEPQNRRVVVTVEVDPQELALRRSEQLAAGMPIPLC